MPIEGAAAEEARGVVEVAAGAEAGAIIHAGLAAIGMAPVDPVATAATAASTQVLVLVVLPALPVSVWRRFSLRQRSRSTTPPLRPCCCRRLRAASSVAAWVQVRVVACLHRHG